MCSCHARGDHPPRRPRRVLRLGRAARRPSPARTARDRRRRASCSRRATRPRRAASARRWAAARPAGSCPDAIVVAPRMSAYSEASKAVFDVFDDTTPLVEGLSIDEAFLDVGGLRRIAGTPTRDRRRACAATSSSESACRSPSASPAPSSSPRSRAAWPSPTGCSWCRPTASSPSSTRSRSNGCGASGRSRPRSCTRRGHHDRRRGRRAARGGARRHARPGAGPPPPRPGAQPRSAAGPGRPAPALDRLAARARPLAEIARRRSTRSLVGARRPGRRGGCVRRGRVGRTVMLRLRFDDFTRATRSHTLPHATAHTRHDPRDVARALLAAAMPMIERAGPHARRHRRSPTSTTTTPSSSRCRSNAAAAGARRRARRPAQPLRLGRRDPSGAARPLAGADDAAASRLTA